MKNKIYTIDCGKNSATIYDGTIVKTVSREELLSLPSSLEGGSTLIGEYSHFGCPRRELSLSQPFTEQELLVWYRDLKQNNVQLKLFPQQSTPRACVYTFGYEVDELGNRRVKKSDETDPIAIFNLVRDFPNTSLMNPPASFAEDKLREEGNFWKSKTNAILNEARTSYQNKGFEDANTTWLNENLDVIATQLSPTTKSVFGLDKVYKVGKLKGELKRTQMRVPQLYSVLSLMRTHQGELRKRELTSALPGWKFIKRYVLCMSPCHFKGGVGRSNLYWHGLRHWVIARAKENDQLNLKGKNRGEFSKAEDAAYLKYRAQYCAAIKELFVTFKIMLER